MKINFFIGTDMEGDSCIYAQHITEIGQLGAFLTDVELGPIVDRLNDGAGVSETEGA